MTPFAEYLRSIRPEAKHHQRPALMTHVVLGYPSLSESIELVKIMAANGAALIELQIPFSDPMADGPTIMAANEAALANGVTVADCFRAAEKLSRAVDVPLLFMSYFNIPFRYKSRSVKGGLRQFCRDAAASGIQALIVPDVPPEETDEGYWTYVRDAGLSPVPIISPVSSDARVRMLGKIAQESFVYCVSTTGTTGARGKLPDGLGAYIQKVSRLTKVPVAVGFGISSAKQVRSLSGVADIAVVGSAMIEHLSGRPKPQRMKAVRDFTRVLSAQ